MSVQFEINFESLFERLARGGGNFHMRMCMGVCHELGSYFQEKIPKRVCQFFTKIPERAIISIRNSRQGQLF